MRIDINPITSKENNEFVVFYDEDLEFKAMLPPVSISDPLYVEKIDDIILYNSDNMQEYQTHTDFIKDINQDNIPLKYVLNNSTEINQIVFESINNTYRVYYEENKGISKYILEHNNKFFHIYPVEEGVIRHLPIYDKDVQIGEALSLCNKKKGNDEYRCFLKEEYCYIADGIVCLLLFMDRNEYSSVYMGDGGSIHNEKTNNPFYKREWLGNNFENVYNRIDDDFEDDSYDDENKENITVDPNRRDIKKSSTANNILLIVGGIWIGIIILLIIAVLFFI